MVLRIISDFFVYGFMRLRGESEGIVGGRFLLKTGFSTGASPALPAYPLSEGFYFSVRMDGILSIFSNNSLGIINGSEKALITMPCTFFSLLRAKTIASRKCFSILENRIPYSPISSAEVNTGKKKFSPFCRISGTSLTLSWWLIIYPMSVSRPPFS